jgi:anti-sigma factor RsiW
MTCRELIEFLDDYMGNGLIAEERQSFEAHLAVCPPCVAYLQTYRRTVELAKTAVRSDPPAELPSELVAAICAARSKKS